jgi:hypothetical protein
LVFAGVSGLVHIRDFGNRIRGQFGQRGHFNIFRGHDYVDDDLDAIKLKIPSFQGKNDPNV